MFTKAALINNFSKRLFCWSQFHAWQQTAQATLAQVATGSQVTPQPPQRQYRDTFATPVTVLARIDNGG